MRPYLAILYDSLIESLSSRVLWILMAGWCLILLALFPLSLSEGESYRVRTGDVAAPKTVLDQLASASAGRGTRAQRAVYSQFDADFQEALRDRQRSGRKIFVGRLVSALNQALDSPELYSAEAWPTAVRREELKSLIEKEGKSAEELQKLNRRLIDLAFPNAIKSSAGQATWITYAGMRFTDPLPLTLRQIRPIIESTVLPLIMWIGLGLIAMMIAIVITSPMVPDMFQTGSLHLLLSKPLSRSLLYLSKYAGGCIFVAINIAFLLVGLYFYSGLQLGIWNRGILWCIPLFIFAFMIFYSVSALVGLVWKNPIICVVITALFWGACFTVGVIRGLSEGFLKGPPTLQRVLVVQGTPIVSNQQGRLQFWNEAQTQWQTAFGDVNGQRVLGPIWRSSDPSLYFARPPFLPFGITTGESTRLELVRLPELTGRAVAQNTEDSAEGGVEKPSESVAVPGEKPKALWDDVRLDSGPDLPVDTLEMLPWHDSFLAVTTSGLFLYDPEAAQRAEESKVTVFGFDMKLPQVDEPYASVYRPDGEWRRPLSIEVSPSQDRAVVISRGVLKHLVWKENRFELVGSLEMEFPAETVVSLAVSGPWCLVCPTGQTPMLVDLESLKIQNVLESIGKCTVKRTATDRDGRMALLTSEGDVWTISSNTNSDSPRFLVTRPPLAGQGDASTIAFDDEHRLWVAHHVKQLDAWNANLTGVDRSFHPRATMPERIFDYVINPFYLINPKPAAVNETIQYVLRNPENKLNVLDRNDLEIPQIERDPWQPLWSNGLFILAMLGLGCWYLYRQDL